MIRRATSVSSNADEQRADLHSEKGSSLTTCIEPNTMPFLDQFRIEALPKKWADEGKLWQERYFPEMPEVFDTPNWSRHYPETPMPRLSVIMAKPDGFAGFAQKVVGATAATGNLTNRLWTADKMPDAQFMTALKIIRAQAGRARPRCFHHRVQEPDGLGNVHVVHRPGGEVPARDAAPFPLRADGPFDAVDAVPRRVVSPRRRGDPHEGDRSRGHPGRRELRDRGSPEDAEHVVSARPRDVRVGARRRPRERRVQDPEEPRGTDHLHRRGARQSEGREPRHHPSEGALLPGGGRRGLAKDHPERGDRARTHERQSPLLAGSAVLPKPPACGGRRPPPSPCGRRPGGGTAPPPRRPREHSDGSREANRAGRVRRLPPRRAPDPVHDESALGIRQVGLPLQ